MKSRVPVGDYRVSADLTITSHRHDVAGRMIPTIPLGVLAIPAPIPLFSREIMRLPADLPQSPTAATASGSSALVRIHPETAGDESAEPAPSHRTEVKRLTR
ncbi:hypothetical protein I6E06_02805 [Bifidobacterium boum]|uniref:hypothetical protein n=1 Tax=Bifidobacterium boum TaxID=78343 RepID=UPI001F1661EF|nr:hypothetical protein [Bifidobacterium boum]MCF2561414.1 hypothetical protein [Bifidobacterium boum]